MTTKTSEPVIETPAADAPETKPRQKPRKLSTTDKLRELHEQAARKVAVLHARADRQRVELAATVRQLNDAREEVARLQGTLPQATAGVDPLLAAAIASGEAPSNVATSQRSNGVTSQAEPVFEVDP